MACGFAVDAKLVRVVFCFTSGFDFGFNFSNWTGGKVHGAIALLIAIKHRIIDLFNASLILMPILTLSLLPSSPPPLPSHHQPTPDT